jgi:general secretion pathway protein H
MDEPFAIGRLRTWPSDAGITLIEMLVVLAIMSIAIAVASSSLRTSSAAVRLGPLRAELANALKTARAAAITGNRPVAVSLDPITRTYRVEGIGSPKRLPQGAMLSLVTGKMEHRSSHDGSLIFFPDGSSTGGLFTLSTARQSVAVRVEWLTGAITVQGGPE